MTVVDLHSHFFPETWPDLAERFGTPDWPWMRRDGPDRAMVMLAPGSSGPSRRPAGTPPCAWPTWTATASTSRSSRPRRCCSPTAARPSTPWSAPGSSTTPCWSCARTARGRLVPICQVPLQDTDLACRELERGLAAGHEGRADRQPRRRPRPRRRRRRDVPGPLRLAGRAGVRAPVGHVRRLPAGGLDAPVDRGHAGRDPAVAQPDDPRRRLRPAPAATCASASPTAAARSRSCSAASRTPGTGGTSCGASRPRRRAPTSTASRSTRRCTTSGRCATWST